MKIDLREVRLYLTDGKWMELAVMSPLAQAQKYVERARTREKHRLNTKRAGLK